MYSSPTQRTTKVEIKGSRLSTKAVVVRIDGIAFTRYAIDASGATAFALERCYISGHLSAANTLALKIDDVFVDGSTGVVSFDVSDSAVTGTRLTIQGGSTCASIQSGQFDLDRLIVRNCTDGLLLGGDYGGGVVSNLLAANNSNSGVKVSSTANVAIVHATVVANGGTQVSCSGTTEIWNSILDPLTGGGGMVAGTCATVEYTNDGGETATGGNGNIKSATQFINAATGDYRLKSTSPGIDAAHDSPSTNLGVISRTLDLDGKPRKVKKKTKTYSADMGAYELQ